MSSWEPLGVQELKESTAEAQTNRDVSHPNPELHKGHLKTQRNQMELL
jgi:hypothetical protein